MIRKLSPAHWSIRTWLIVIIAIGLVGMLTGCSTNKDAPVNDCIVTVGTAYVNHYGPLDATTWNSLRTDCADQVEQGEWP